jgi:hypothetical protein
MLCATAAPIQDAAARAVQRLKRMMRKENIERKDKGCVGARVGGEGKLVVACCSQYHGLNEPDFRSTSTSTCLLRVSPGRELFGGRGMVPRPECISVLAFISLLSVSSCCSTCFLLLHHRLSTYLEMSLNVVTRCFYLSRMLTIAAAGMIPAVKRSMQFPLAVELGQV